MLLERAYITKLYIKKLEIGKHSFVKVQVNADNSLYWNKHFYDLDEQNYCILFSNFLLYIHYTNDREIDR